MLPICQQTKHQHNSVCVVQEAGVSGLERPFVISGRETELESSASLRLAELERGSMVSKENIDKMG